MYVRRDSGLHPTVIFPIRVRSVPPLSHSSQRRADSYGTASSSARKLFRFLISLRGGQRVSPPSSNRIETFTSKRAPPSSSLKPATPAYTSRSRNPSRYARDSPTDRRS